MERIIDKTIISLCCVATLFLVPFSTSLVIGLLLALIVSAFRETMIFSETARNLFLIMFLVGAVLVKEFILFVPLIAYDCFRMKPVILKLCWLVPLIASFWYFEMSLSLFVLVVSFIACALAWRTNLIEHERIDSKRLRDELRELSLRLERKNRDLQEKQDYEVKLATLDERGRIAREIHDNVGHLLTRSVLQIEALQVVHADDERVRSGLAQVGTTIHEAFGTIRESVHDLHDDSFDLHTQLFSITKQSPSLEIDLDYQSGEVPQTIAYCFLAIVREALANVEKHSNARKVKISVSEYPAFWQLIIHDDGVLEKKDLPLFPRGTESTSVISASRDIIRGGSGIGFKTMDERTRSLGGILRIDYDRGVRVFVSVPKEQEKQQDQ